MDSVLSRPLQRGRPMTPVSQSPTQTLVTASQLVSHPQRPLHRVYSHLDLAGSSIRVLFFDFSSAFNTLIPHILANKLIHLKVNNTTVNWILEYLTSRPQ